MVIKGQLDFYDCGELEGTFECECEAKVGFCGRSIDTLDEVKGYALWCFKGEEKLFEKESKDLRCLFCNQKYEISKEIIINKI